MYTSQGSADLHTHHLGPHPILSHFLQRLNLHAIVNTSVGLGRERVLTHGEALASLVHNVLDSPAPLYLYRSPEQTHLRSVNQTHHSSQDFQQFQEMGAVG